MRFFVKYAIGCDLRSIVRNGQFAAQIIETWQANSSTGDTPTAKKPFVAMASHSFLVPTHLIAIR